MNMHETGVVLSEILSRVDLNTITLSGLSKVMRQFPLHEVYLVWITIRQMRALSK